MRQYIPHYFHIKLADIPIILWNFSILELTGTTTNLARISKQICIISFIISGWNHNKDDILWVLCNARSGHLCICSKVLINWVEDISWLLVILTKTSTKLRHIINPTAKNIHRGGRIIRYLTFMSFTKY